MQTRISEIAKDTYRVSAFHPEFGIQFNQFLVVDDEPFLMHTGFKGSFDTTLAGVRSVMDPARLRWIGFSHFESDECGALNAWLAVAPKSQAVCGTVGALVSVNDFADRPPRALDDGEVLVTGRHRLRFLATPQVPHGWDAGLFFDEIEATLFCSDLFFQPGDPDALSTTDIVASAREAIRAGLGGPMARDMPYTPYTASTFARLAALAPRTLATMHGSSFRGDGRRAIVELSATIDELLGGGSST
jgi:flavorubredoxin